MKKEIEFILLNIYHQMASQHNQHIQQDFHLMIITLKKELLLRKDLVFYRHKNLI